MKQELPDGVLQAPPHTLWVVPRESAVDLYAREDNFMAACYPARCSLDVQLGVWEDDKTICVLLLVRVGALDAATFDYRINLAESSGLRLLKLLAEQEVIDLYLVTDRVIRSIRNHSRIREKAAIILHKIRDHPMWTKKDYARKMAEVDRLYPTSVALWWAAREQNR